MHHKQAGLLAALTTRQQPQPCTLDHTLKPDTFKVFKSQSDLHLLVTKICVQEALLLEQGRLQKLLEAEKQLLSSADEPKLSTAATAAAATAGMAPEPHGPEDGSNGADGGDQGVSADPLDAFMTDLSTQMDTDKVREQPW